MSESKHTLESIYNLPVYVTWDKVPKGYYTKTALKKKGIKNIGNPKGIKGGGLNRTWYFLYEIPS